jgi:hypothetical protein
MKAMLVMRDALIEWLSATVLHEAAVYMIIRDPATAVIVAKQIGAAVVTIDPVTHQPQSA